MPYLPFLLRLFYLHTYLRNRPGDDLAPELKELSLTIFIASVAGFLFGGMIGARHSGDKFITHNHASKFTSVMQAQVPSVACTCYVCRGGRGGYLMYNRGFIHVSASSEVYVRSSIECV